MPTRTENNGWTNGTTSTKLEDMGCLGLTRVCLWDLSTDEPVRKLRKGSAIYHGRQSLENVCGKDDRELVSDEDIMPGGKYRAIVKLFLHFADQDEDDFSMATGWLIRNDLVVTAGHCCFDHAHTYGRLTSIQVYMGYKGRASINDSKFEVQKRMGKTVATTLDWYQHGDNEAWDVSFIKLNSPFTGVTPLAFESTPQSGRYTLGVVGYPGDLEDPKTREKAAFMYEMFDKEKYDLATAVDQQARLLQYELDTFGGNSGSPVLKQTIGSDGGFKSIGVHVFGGVHNSASMIGPNGNNFRTYIDALSAYAGDLPAVKKERDEKDRWLVYIDLPGFPDPSPAPSPPNPDGKQENIEEGRGTLGGNIEGLDPVLKSVLNKAVGVIKRAGPTEALEEGQPIVLGKTMRYMAPQIGALSAVALHAAGRMAASRTGTELTEKVYSFEGAAERAVLGESAIEALRRMGNARCKELGVFKTMADSVRRLRPTVMGASPTILPAVAGPVLRLTIDELARKRAEGTEDIPAEDKRHFRSLERERNTKVGLLPEQELSNFIQHFEMACNKESAQEFLGIASTIGDLIGLGLRHIPSLLNMAKAGLSLFSGGHEDVEDASPAPFEGYAERALVGEAALESLVKLGPEKCQQEGLFDVMVDVIGKLGPLVIKAAPHVIDAVGPIVKNALANRAARKSGTELIGALAVHDGTIASWPLLELADFNEIRRGQGFVQYMGLLETAFALPDEEEHPLHPVNIPGQGGLAAARIRDIVHYPDEARRLGLNTVVRAFDEYLRVIRRSNDPVLAAFDHDVSSMYEVFGRRVNFYQFGHKYTPVATHEELENSLQTVKDEVEQSPGGHFGMLYRLLNRNDGSVRYVQGPEVNQVMRNWLWDDQDAVRLNVHGVFVDIRVEEYCHMLKDMMTQFTLHTRLTENLGIWQETEPRDPLQPPHH
ncbi:hypothetical protein OQA88_9446 [Cercophora sp. LCS_1]